uniref:Uncharacterized protein n=1 Tax=Plectus sambesii TaxID=2011161 RepID=A0A914V3I1_9BILA
MFDDTDYVPRGFVNVAVDLCRYEFDTLVVEGMFLLHRYHSSFEDMFSRAMQTQLLITERSKEVHAIVEKNLREIRLMLADRNIDAENSRNLKRILEEFSILCYMDGNRLGDAHPINQQILVNFGVLDDVIDILNGQVDIESDAVSDIYRNSFQLLMAMAHGNPIVQQRLFDRMFVFLKIE